MRRRFAKMSSAVAVLCCVGTVAATAVFVAGMHRVPRAAPDGAATVENATQAPATTTSPATTSAPSTPSSSSASSTVATTSSRSSANAARSSVPSSPGNSDAAAARAGDVPPPAPPWFAGRVGDATRVISVVGSGGSNAVLSTWQKSGSDWSTVVGEVAAKVGPPGISGSYGESTPATPAGVFPVTSAFGRQPDPGTGVSYLRVDTSDWWVSDVNSPDYNTHQRCAPGTCPFDEQVSEDLYNAGPVYDYALVLGVNSARVPGGGSAYFLHVTNGAATEGCVAIPAGTLVSIMRWVRPGTVIALSPH